MSSSDMKSTRKRKKKDIESHERESPNSVKKPKPYVRKYPTVLKCVSANIHQGSNNFSEFSRGKQCIANSLVCIAYNAVNQKLFENWDSNDIHFVLTKGDILYKHARQTCPHEYLNPEDLPQNVCILNQLLHI